jgi:hypothetical protein
VRPGSLILSLSDFAGLDAAVETSWPGRVSHSVWRLFWVTDPLEEQALPNGRFRAGLPDSVRVLDGAGVRHRWLEAWRLRQSRVEALGRLLAAPVIRLDTREPVQEALGQELGRTKALA